MKFLDSMSYQPKSFRPPQLVVGTRVWRQMVPHAEKGLIPLPILTDGDSSKAPLVQIPGIAQPLVGWRVFAVAGDGLEKNSVLPERSTLREAGWRLLSRHVNDRRKPVGIHVFLNEYPGPECVAVDIVSITPYSTGVSEEGFQKRFYVYQGEVVTDVKAACERYFDLYKTWQSSNGTMGAAFMQNKRLLDRLSEMFDPETLTNALKASAIRNAGVIEARPRDPASAAGSVEETEEDAHIVVDEVST